MEEISYITAWSLWFDGKLDNNFIIGPFSIIWWGRIGKVLQLLASFTLLIDIVGATKVYDFGKSIEKDISLSMIKEIIRKSIVGMYSTYLSLLPNSYESDIDSDSFIENMGKLAFINMLFLLCYIYYHYSFLMDIIAIKPYYIREGIFLTIPVAILMQANLKKKYPHFSPYLFTATTIVLMFSNVRFFDINIDIFIIFEAFEYIFTVMFFVPVVSAIVFIAITLFFSVLSTSLATLVLKPLALSMQKVKDEKTIRKLSLVLILIGFQFDLLSS